MKHSELRGEPQDLARDSSALEGGESTQAGSFKVSGCIPVLMRYKNFKLCVKIPKCSIYTLM